MKTAGMRMLIASVAASAALMAVAFPAVAAEEKAESGNAYGQQKDEENFQEADKESSAQATEEKSKGKPSEESSTRETSSSSETTTSSHTSDSDGPGKNFDNEGSPRGESSTQCENTHGGTGSGRVYDSTCDGAASKAGNGSGGAGGRPCAGCVGNADYKEPKGQLNDGDHDGNAGYECDGNNGLARSNPAHTACPRPGTTVLCPPGTDFAGLPPGSTGCNNLPPTQVCPPGTDMAGLPPGVNGCDLPPGEKCPPGTDRAGLPPGPTGCNEDDVQGRIDKVCPEGTDLAGEDMTDVEDCVLGKVIHNNGEPDRPLGAVLPFTGGKAMLPLLALALLMLVMGGAVLTNSRLRSQE